MKGMLKILKDDKGQDHLYPAAIENVSLSFVGTEATVEGASVFLRLHNAKIQHIFREGPKGKEEYGIHILGFQCCNEIKSYQEWMFYIYN